MTTIKKFQLIGLGFMQDRNHYSIGKFTISEMYTGEYFSFFFHHGIYPFNDSVEVESLDHLKRIYFELYGKELK